MAWRGTGEAKAARKDIVGRANDGASHRGCSCVIGQCVFPEIDTVAEIWLHKPRAETIKAEEVITLPGRLATWKGEGSGLELALMQRHV